jgi:hypothetical protein
MDRGDMSTRVVKPWSRKTRLWSRFQQKLVTPVLRNARNHCARAAACGYLQLAACPVLAPNGMQCRAAQRFNSDLNKLQGASFVSLLVV